MSREALTSPLSSPLEVRDPRKPAACYAFTMKHPCVYILVNHPHGTFYVGVTGDLNTRMAQHDQGLIDGFTKRYGIRTLVYYETHETFETAFKWEKLLKRWNRAWKVRLVEQMNPEWQSLFNPSTGEIAFGPAETERLSAEPVYDVELPGSPPSRG
jgi:putative endonuclease